jgi:hypothetical protein
VTISPRENFKRRLSGGDPLWIPFHGIMNCDTKVFLPRMNREFVARHAVMDCEPQYDYASDVFRSDWFDLEWQYVKAAGGSTVRPGNDKVPDIAHWEDYVSLPSVEQFDWIGCHEKNQGFFETDKLRETAIFTSFWERLMSLMGVGNAAIAMVDEEQKEGVHRLFDKLSGFYCEYITRMKQLFPIEMFQLHDDWCHQNGPFFSLSTAMEMLVPYVKRVADHCRNNSIFFELHCCGRADILLPAIIETGADLWCPQPINDIYEMACQYRDCSLYFGVPESPLPDDATVEETSKSAKEWVKKHKDLKVVASFVNATDAFKSSVYKYRLGNVL